MKNSTGYRYIDYMGYGAEHIIYGHHSSLVGRRIRGKSLSVLCVTVPSTPIRVIRVIRVIRRIHDNSFGGEALSNETCAR